MRPLRLTLEGFRSYANRATFDFRDRSLVGVVGPTGSGKSSILDGLAFALYGSAPSLGARDTKPLIYRWDPVSKDAPAVAQVELWFEASGETYRIQRLIRPKGQGGQKLELYDAVDGVLIETMSDKVREIGATIEDLTGLDYDGFCRAVLLAQNQFQQLLMATKKEAGDVLTGLLGFGIVEQMQKITKSRLEHTKGELAAAEAAKEQYDKLKSAASEAQSALEAASGRRNELESIADEMSGVETAIAALETEASEAEDAARAREQALASLPTATEVEGVVSDATQHRQLLAAADAELKEASDALTAAAKALDAAHEADIPLHLGKLESAIEAAAKASSTLTNAQTSLAEADRRHEAALAEITAAVSAEEEAATAAESASVVAEESGRHLGTLEAAHAAYLLAEGLAAGEPCPVCRRTVDETPFLEEAEGLEEARQAAADARRSAAAASEAHQRARQRAQLARAAVAHVADDLAAARATAGAAGQEASEANVVLEGLVVALGGDPSDPRMALREAKRAYGELKGTKDSAAAAVESAQLAHRHLVETDALAPLTELVARHREVAVALGMDWDATTEPAVAGLALEKFRLMAEGAVEKARSAAAAAAERLGSAQDQRTRLLKEVGLAEGADYGAAITQATVAEAERTAVLRERQGQLDGASKALASARQKHALEIRLRRLHSDLASGRFPQYLIDEKRRDLVASGSNLLRLLSADRYELTTAGDEFAIRDLTAAGMVRHPKTLSGGEMFLASLALALGLATVVGPRRGAAEAFFIDEGFGSLDAESLDLAMEGIERLVGDSNDRLVVVVSHVPEMRARIEDLIVLGKDEVTGTTIVHPS